MGIGRKYRIVLETIFENRFLVSWLIYHLEKPTFNNKVPGFQFPANVHRKKHQQMTAEVLESVSLI